MSLPVKIGANSYGPDYLNASENSRISFDNVDDGPVKMLITNGEPQDHADLLKLLRVHGLIGRRTIRDA